MADIRIELNHAAVAELLKGPEIAADLKRRAAAIASAAGAGMEVDTSSGGSRARASVRTATVEAMLNEAKHRALTRAIDAGR